MKDFENNGLNELSIDEINELYNEVVEMPEILIATICGLPKVLNPNDVKS